MKYPGELLQSKKGHAAVVTSWHWTLQSLCLLRMREVWKAASPPGKSTPTSQLSQEPEEFTKLFSFRGKEPGGETDFVDFVTTQVLWARADLCQPKMWMCLSVCVCVKVCLSVSVSVCALYWQLQPVLHFQQGKRKLKEKSRYFSQYSSYSTLEPKRKLKGRS